MSPPDVQRRRLAAALTCTVGLMAVAACSPVGGREALYDTHAHFFSADVARYPIDTSGTNEGQQALADRVRTHPNDAGTVLRAWHKNGVIGGVGVQYSSVYKTDNHYLLDVHAGHQRDIAAVATLNPLLPDTPAIMRSMARDGAIAGIRFTGKAAADGSYPWIDSPLADPAWAAARDLDLAVVLMALPAVRDERELSAIATMADRYPTVPIVLDHLGWAIGPAPDFGLGPLERLFQRRPNVFFKFTSVNIAFLRRQGLSPAAYLRRAVDLFGADRVMWGSDFGNTPEDFAAMAADIRLAGSVLTKTERRKVFRLTGERLFGARR